MGHAMQCIAYLYVVKILAMRGRLRVYLMQNDAICPGSGNFGIRAESLSRLTGFSQFAWKHHVVWIHNKRWIKRNIKYKSISHDHQNDLYLLQTALYAFCFNCWRLLTSNTSKNSADKLATRKHNLWFVVLEWISITQYQRLCGCLYGGPSSQ